VVTHGPFAIESDGNVYVLGARFFFDGELDIAGKQGVDVGAVRVELHSSSSSSSWWGAAHR
jgi:hypothetical protein